jgi:hypothetical protein
MRVGRGRGWVQRSGQFDLLEEIGSGHVNLYVIYIFRSLIDFDWIEGNLILGRVKSSRVWIGLD